MSQEFYAVIYKKTVHIPGDERSRTDPGHGYPAHTEEFDAIEVFKDFDELHDWVQKEEKRSIGKRSYRAIAFSELRVTTEVIISNPGN